MHFSKCLDLLIDPVPPGIRDTANVLKSYKCDSLSHDPETNICFVQLKHIFPNISMYAQEKAFVQCHSIVPPESYTLIR